jgi:hypothetical protein
MSSLTSLRILGTSLLCCAIASPVVADVTIKSKASGSGFGAAAAGDTTQQIKGQKVRIDQTTGEGRQTSTIIDIAAKQMVTLNHDKKEAEVIDMTSLGATLAKAGVSEINVSITPTPATRQIAGQTCNVYDLKVAVPMPVAQMKMAMVLSGPQCLVKNGPGQADFMAFYRAASEGGAFLDANQAKGQPAMAKAMTDMYRKMSELGIPFASEMKMGIEGEGPMAEAMKKMGTTITTEVTSISTAPVPESAFETPAGYKVKKR